MVITQLVFTYSNTVSRIGGAVVTEGSASVSSTSVSGNTVIVNLTNVLNAQRVTVNVLDVHDSAGNVSAATSSPAMRFLIGDTSNNGSVTAAPMSVKRRASQALLSVPVTSARMLW